MSRHPSTVGGEQGVIQGHQLMAILITGRVVPITVTFPSMTGASSPQDVWISMLLSTVATVPIALWIVHLGSCFPEKTIVEYSEILLGKVWGKLLSLGLIFYFISIAATTARELGEAYTVAIMPETPILVFMVAMAFVGANAARGGLEIVGRMAEIIMWLIFAFTVLVLTLPANSMQLENLKPMLSKGLLSTTTEAGTSLVIFMEIIVMGMIMPYLTRPGDAKRFSLYAIGIVGLTGAVFAVVLVAVFGVLASSLSLPAFSLGRTISVSEFLERIEIIPMGAWTLSAGIKLACFLWAGAVGLAQWCGLQRYQPLVYPLSMLALSLGILYFHDITEIDVFADVEHVGMWIILLVVGSLLILSLAQSWRAYRARADGS